jgi:hypothetical protein
MPFQMRDETAGVNILYVDNSNQMGLGSLPIAGQQLTVQGSGVVTIGGDFGCGVLGVGATAPVEGSIAIPANSTATVPIVVNDIPTVGADSPAISVSSSSVIFSNNTGASRIAHYSIW